MHDSHNNQVSNVTPCRASPVGTQLERLTSEGGGVEFNSQAILTYHIVLPGLGLGWGLVAIVNCTNEEELLCRRLSKPFVTCQGNLSLRQPCPKTPHSIAFSRDSSCSNVRERLPSGNVPCKRREVYRIRNVRTRNKTCWTGNLNSPVSGPRQSGINGGEAPFPSI